MNTKQRIVLVIFILLLCASYHSHSQNSVEYVEWYESFFKKQQASAEEALRLANVNLRKAEEEKQANEKSRAFISLGLIQLTRLNDYEKALDYLIKSLSIADSLNLRNEKIFTYLAIARVFEEVNNYRKSLEFLNEARALSDTNDNHLKAMILNESGRVNTALENMEDAFQDYEMLIEYAEELRQTRRKADALFHLARLYTKKRDYSKALDQHKKALAIRRSAKDKLSEAISLNDIGELYNLTKNNERALANYVAAIEIRRELKDIQGLAESYNNVGVLYYKNKNFERSIANLQLALQSGHNSQSQDQLRKSYEYLSLCYKNLKNYNKALEYKEQLMDITEFIQRERDERQLLEAQTQYIVNKRELEIDRLHLDQALRQKEIATQKKLRNFLFLIIGLGVAIVVLILYQYIHKQKLNKELQLVNKKVNQQNSELQDLNATKDKFFSIISHDVKGPLNSLTSFSTLLINHTDSLSKEEIQMLAKDLDKSLKNLFALLENLLEWSRSQTGAIEFKTEEFDIAAVLHENEELLKTQAHNKKITLIPDHNGTLKVKAHRHSVNTVIRNLLSNAIKFTPGGGTITLSAQKNENEIKISITDTGVGMPPEIVQKLFRIDSKHSTKGTADEKGTGLGLILCKEFIEKNGGRIGVESEVGKGSTFYFVLPN